VTGETVSPEDLSPRCSACSPTRAPPRRRAAHAGRAGLTTQEAQALGVQEVIGSFTSRHPCCAPRVTNIHRIADIVDGHVVLPGERFDLNELTGPRDRARGFVDAPQILEGEFVDRIGGGISQFVTTMFNAGLLQRPQGRRALAAQLLHQPLPARPRGDDLLPGARLRLRERQPARRPRRHQLHRHVHHRDVLGDQALRRGPLGHRPRTRLRDFDVQYVQRDDCTATDGEQGFDIVVTREFVKGGQVVAREPFRTRYKPEPKFVCGPPPD
jgi:hypothetical protein